MSLNKCHGYLRGRNRSNVIRTLYVGNDEARAKSEIGSPTVCNIPIHELSNYGIAGVDGHGRSRLTVIWLIIDACSFRDEFFAVSSRQPLVHYWPQLARS